MSAAVRRAEREGLRQKGQFWTPAWVAEAMTAYVAPGADEVFDPGAGMGAFCAALKAWRAETGGKARFYGTDNDPDVLRRARAQGVYDERCRVEVRDFILDPPQRRFAAVVGNPPYMRHHRLSASLKARLSAMASAALGARLDARAGLHVYFLIQALGLLAEGGRLAFIMPADTCEGVFARVLWRWITRRFRLEAAMTFAPEATPFPDVDTNAVVFFIRNAPPGGEVRWGRCLASGEPFRRWVAAGFPAAGGPGLRVETRGLEEAVETGLSREARKREDGFHLGDFFRVMRGIATGANDFFFLTRGRAGELRIPEAFLLPAVGRTRDVPGDLLDGDAMEALEARGRPTRLFSPDGRPWEAYPASVRRYLLEGEKRGLPARALISTRRPWYKMEKRLPPPFLFAYLGRRNTRFIRNAAGAVPLTGFLCVYPRDAAAGGLDSLWEMLRNPRVVGNLPLIGKSYGGGAVKVEPRALERLPIPGDIVGVSAFGLPRERPARRAGLDFQQACL